MYITNNDDVEILRNLILSKKYFRNQGKNSNGQCNQFEESFALKMNSEHCLLVTSGTNALICALSSLDLKADDEVIMPSFTYFATAVAIVRSNGIPVIVNIDDSLMIDPLEVEKAITSKTKAIIAVHMDGHPCDMNSLTRIAKKYNITLIEDVAQACGGSFKGEKLGSIGDIGCFSFNVDKIISCGEGGAIITRNRSFYEKSLCHQDACCSFGPTFKDSFTEISPFIGQSMRVSEISGALMNVQLTRLDFILDELKKRQKIIKDIFVKNNINIIPSNDEDGDCATSMYLSLQSSDEVKNVFIDLAKNNIATFPITNRYAHACWQWMHLLEKELPHRKYVKSSFLHSIDLLSSVLKINVPFDLSLNETEEYAHKIVKVIKP